MNTEIGPVEYRGKKHIFQIVTPGRVYFMQGASDSDIDHWIKSLKEAQNPKGKASQGAAPPARVNAPDSDEEVRSSEFRPLRHLMYLVDMVPLTTAAACPRSLLALLLTLP